MKASKTTLEAFEGFWAAYPRRPDNPKAAAREVFVRRVREGADPAEIVRAAEAYARHSAASKLDPKFIPHARTWLSQRRWEDFLEADVPASADDVQPSPDHPLAWMHAEIGDAAWRSWIEPLVVHCAGDATFVRSPTQFALQHVQRVWGAAIAARLGPVTWTVAPKEAL